MIALLIYVLIAAIVFWVLWYIVTLLPAEIQGVARIVVIVLAAIFLIYILLTFAGGMPSLGPHNSRPLRP